jgi:hypothetical protein
VFGVLRFAQAGRIIKAAEILRERAGLTGRWAKVPMVAAGVLVAAFVAVVLAAPTSRTRSLLEDSLGGAGGVVAVLLAGGLLAFATFVGRPPRGSPPWTSRASRALPPLRNCRAEPELQPVITEPSSPRA